MNKSALLTAAMLLTALATVAACTPVKAKLPVNPYQPAPSTVPTLPGQADYLSRITLDPASARYFGEVRQALGLTSDETTLLQQNGFVVTDRLAWDRFLDAYAWIYSKDLPVLVTTDSILHSVHQSYDDILQDIERTVLIPELQTLLGNTAQQLTRARVTNTNRELDPLYRDVSVYVWVAIYLLNATPPADSPAKELYQLAVSASDCQDVNLFGSERKIDFTLFKPRGHYAGQPVLEQYFRAMSWLAQVDFRFVEFDPADGKPIFRQSQVVAAAIFRDAIDAAGMRFTWNKIDRLLAALVGESDNTALPDLDRFMADMGFTGPADVLKGDARKMRDLLLNGDYGNQRITGQLLYRDPTNFSSEPVSRPVSFMLMGQRFAIDSYVLGNLVYDRMIKDGRPIERALPSTLDVMYSLGNDRALAHLADELGQIRLSAAAGGHARRGGLAAGGFLDGAHLQPVAGHDPHAE